MEDLGKIKMPFGSFKGKALEHIYKWDREYLTWVRYNCGQPIADQVADFLAQKNKEIVERGKNK